MEPNPDWHARIGRYRPVRQTEFELAQIDYFDLVYRDGAYMAEMQAVSGERVTYIIQPNSADTAILAGVGRGLSETISVGDDGVVSYSGLTYAYQTED